MIVALIPARGGSKGIPKKNIKKIAGKPLLHYAIEAASKSRLIDKVYVSTDSPEIASMCDSLAWVFNRNPKAATDEASTADVMMDFANQVDFDHLVVIQCTSPQLTAKDLDAGIEKYLNGKCDSLLSVVRQHRFIWREEDGYAYPVNHSLHIRPRRQDWDGMLVENGAFIIRNRKSLMITQGRLAGKVCMYEMAEDSYIEIDNMDDFIMVERLLEDKA